jgi:predicted short-subunit dehydrogenase-like oxidoreductase (DUF2520 family)
MEKGLKLSFIGNGNMAYQLSHAFSKAGFVNMQLYARDIQKHQSLFEDLSITYVDSIDAIDGGVIFICTNDTSIEEISSKITTENGIVVHTSGSTPLSVLNHKYTGVFYPPQTLTKNVLLDRDELPLMITANEVDVRDKLLSLANTISSNVSIGSDDERLKLHCTAVLLNNFINHLASKVYNYTEKNNLDYGLLNPILKRTYEKISSKPYDFQQTGPAKRGDEITMQKHLDLLQEDIHLVDIYKTISKSIHHYENNKGI